MKTRRKKILVALTLLLLIAVVVTIYCDHLIEKAARGKTYTEISSLPSNRVGLLLGTGKYLKDGRINPYYANRITATAQLFKNNKISYLVISGDNSRVSYNEPETMRSDLILEGIDSTKIFLDYAGFRTLDSVVRLREIFSQDTVTIISQQFHNERALYIAQREGLSAQGFNAQDVTALAGFKTQFREKLARVKVFVDYIFGVDPKFLGPKVDIPM